MQFDQTSTARLADFVQFAYNMYRAGGLTPPPDPGIDAAGYRLSFRLTARDFRETAFYGYIAQSKTDPADVIIAIRGTQNTAEWVLDFSALPVFFHAGADAGFVALGFQSIQQSFVFSDDTGVTMSLADAITRIAAQQAIKGVIILGHSLGAALATLTAAELAVRNTAGVKPLLTIYTYASPRVGLLDFASWFNNNIPVSYRIWNLLDIVPEVPTFPFIHVSGLGDRIVQTTEQMSILQKTPQCEHNLGSYQWLLDPGDYPLNNGCSAQQAQAHAMLVAAPAGGAGIPNADRSGAIALQRAVAGRV